MKSHFCKTATKVIISLLLIWTAHSEAKVTKMNTFFYELGIIDDPQFESCEEIRQVGSSNQSEESLFHAVQIPESSYCKQYQKAQTFLQKFPHSKYALAVHQLSFEYLFAAQDHIQAINDANELLDFSWNLELKDLARLQIARSVLQKWQSTQSIENKAKWTFLAMGVDVSQNEQSPYLKNLSLRTLIDSATSETVKSEIKLIYEIFKKEFGYRVLSEGRLQRMKFNYTEALKKFDLLVRWGPSMTAFEEAIFEVVATKLELAYRIKSPGLLSDVTANRILNRAWGQFLSPAERESLSKQTLDSADKTLAQMQTGIKQSRWTEKAIQLRRGYFGL